MEYLNLNSFETKRSVTIDSLKTHFLPIQEGEGDPSPDNIRPITGWNSIKVRKCGKNLAKVFGFDTSTIRSVSQVRYKTNSWGTTISETNYVDELVITQDGYKNSSNVGHYSNGYFAIGLDTLSLDKRYNVSFKITKVVSNPLNASLSDIRISNPYGNLITNSVVAEDGKIIFKNYWYRKNTDSPDRCSIEVYNCGMSFTLSEFMITAVEDEDFTYEPYREEEVEVELPETVYGGYVDIAKGEIVQEYVCEEPNDRDWSITTSYAYQGGHSTSVSITNISMKLMVCTNWINKAFDNKKMCLININKFMVVCKEYFDAANVSMDNESIKAHFEELKANGTPFKICAPLLTPIHYSLSPETLKTLRGFNTIFSTGNDTIEVGYSEMSPINLLGIRRMMMNAQPYVFVDHIVGTGYKSRIDTGVPGDDDTLKFEGCFSCDTYTAWFAFFGNYTKSGDNFWRLAFTDSDIGSLSWITNASVGFASRARQGSLVDFRVQFMIENLHAIYTADEHVTEGTRTSKTSGTTNNTNIAIGSPNTTNDSGGYVKTTWYYFKIYQGETLIRDYKPCLRIADRKYGFFETLSKTFCPSIGTVDFSAN